MVDMSHYNDFEWIANLHWIFSLYQTYIVGSAINTGWQLKSIDRLTSPQKNKNSLEFDWDAIVCDGCNLMVHFKSQILFMEEEASATNLDRRLLRIVDLHQSLGHARKVKVPNSWVLY
jgi:hypothetical protein